MLCKTCQLTPVSVMQSKYPHFAMYLRGEIKYKKPHHPRIWRQTKNVSIYFTKAGLGSRTTLSCPVT